MLDRRGLSLFALVNNAGVINGDVLDINFWGAKRTTEAFLPLLLENMTQSPKVVNVGSDLGPKFVGGIKNAEDKLLFTSGQGTDE